MADVADALPEALPSLVEVGRADVIGRGQVVVEPAEEIRLVGFVEVMAIGTGHVVERGPAVLRRNSRVDLLQRARSNRVGKLMLLVGHASRT